MHRRTLITLIGLFAFVSVALAQPLLQTDLIAAARRALPASISTNDITKALAAGLWTSNRTAVAIGLTNSTNPNAWVFLSMTSGQFLAVDVSLAGLGISQIGDAPRSAYERLEVTPLQWLPRREPQDTTLMIMMRTRAWRDGQRYQASRVLWIYPDGRVGTQ